MTTPQARAGVRDAILKQVTFMVSSIDDLYAKVKDDTAGRGRKAFESFYLTPMVMEGLIDIDAFGLVTTSKAGRLLAKRSNLVPHHLYTPPAGNYSGEELGRTSHRQGAYDFMDHPSLISGERISYGY